MLLVGKKKEIVAMHRIPPSHPSCFYDLVLLFNTNLALTRFGFPKKKKKFENLNNFCESFISHSSHTLPFIFMQNFRSKVLPFRIFPGLLFAKGKKPRHVTALSSGDRSASHSESVSQQTQSDSEGWVPKSWELFVDVDMV